MQLVGSVFVAIAPVLILTFIINQDWFWKFSPEWLKQYATESALAEFAWSACWR